MSIGMKCGHCGETLTTEEKGSHIHAHVVQERELQSRIGGTKDSDCLNTVVLMKPTSNLRWSKDGKLQQLWADLYSTETEWRDVPTEE
jgi:hypothetical protein